MAISLARTGMTSRCSRVPCSRSRMTAAPTSTTARMVMLLITCMIDVNHLDVLFGLNRVCTTARVGRRASTPCTLRYSSVSRMRISLR